MQIDRSSRWALRCSTIVVAGWLVAMATAGAQESALVIELGKTVERNVGYARGWACDDPDLVTADLATRGDHNVWVATGKRLGSTLCRIGTDPYGVSHVFNVRVVARAGAGTGRGS